jgi:6-phosphogluconate dehydrogenase, C-terminal domain
MRGIEVRRRVVFTKRMLNNLSTHEGSRAPIFSALAPGIGDIPRTPGRGKLDGTAEQGYLHCGPNGAGHFVKMVHNGIEYGVLAAYAGGLSVLRSANAGKQQHGIDAETTPLRDPERSIGGTGAPGGGSLISEVTDSPLSGRATLK